MHNTGRCGPRDLTVNPFFLFGLDMEKIVSLKKENSSLLNVPLPALPYFVM